MLDFDTVKKLSLSGSQWHSHRMIEAKWTCLACGQEHSKYVDRNFCFFEYVCFYRHSTRAYIVRLNLADCLICPPSLMRCSYSQSRFNTAIK